MYNLIIGIGKCFRSVPGAVFAIVLMAVNVYLVTTALKVSSAENILTAMMAAISTIILMLIIRYIGIAGMLIVASIGSIAILKYYETIVGAMSAIKF